jgi:hypothetical protein
MGMTKADAAKALPAAMVTHFVVTTAAVPSIMVAAPTMRAAMVAMSVPYFNHATIRRRHRGNAQPGGSGYAHRQRSKQRRNYQNEASHPFHLPSRDRDEAQVPER